MPRPLTLLTLFLALVPTARAQDWRALPVADRAAREGPTLVAWQRSVQDALALSQESGRPLLVCVNLDGEPASEAFAWHKYKNPSFAALIEPWIPLIVSPTRHNDRDHDERGRRIPCPRFGAVTCGEHLAAEAPAYERWFSGRRVAPRHVGVTADGDVLFDRFLDQDLGRVDDALRSHAPRAGSDAAVRPASHDLLASRAAADRAAVEAEYLQAQGARKLALLEAAASAPSRPLELVRLGLHEEDASLRLAAERALAALAEAKDLQLVLDALARQSAPEARAPLVAALERLAADEPRARSALVAQRAVGEPSALVDVARWQAALARGDGADDDAGAAFDGLDEPALTAKLEEYSKALDASPRDAGAALGLARTSLALARERMATGGNPTFFLVDAGDQAKLARSLGAAAADTALIRAESAWLLNNPRLAVETASEALPGLLARAASPDAARVLGILARTRTNAIYEADKGAEPWPGEWLSDARAAFEVLSEHPSETPEQAVAHCDLLAYLRLDAFHERALFRALERFPADGEVHARFRAFVERERGLGELEAAYAERAGGGEPDATSLWFDAYAALVVAEHEQRQNDARAADAAYRRAIERFDASVALEPSYAESADHFVALAHSGRARLAFEADELDAAADDLIASLRRRPASAELPDGLDRTPLETLRVIVGAAGREGRRALLVRLEQEIVAVAPEVWEQRTEE